MEGQKYNGLKSPHEKHRCHFLLEGEIRFGPAYYRVELDGNVIEGKIFGYGCKWHPEEKYLALQEWLTIDYQEGPITALTLVDLLNGKMARISKAEKGFITPLKFENDFIIFEKEWTASLGQKIECEISLKNIHNWE